MFKLFMFLKCGARSEPSVRDLVTDFAAATCAGRPAKFYRVVAAADRLGTESHLFAEPRFDLIVDVGYGDEPALLSALRSIRDGVSGGWGPSFGQIEHRIIGTQVHPQRELPVGSDPSRLFVPVRKMPGGERSAFHAHWFGHGALILETIPGVRGYLQNHTVDTAYGIDPDSWDGVAEFWFESLAVVDQLSQTDPAAFARIAVDELAFLGSVPIENYVTLAI